MVLRNGFSRWPGRLGLACLSALAGMIAVLTVSQSAAAETSPCIDPRIQQASVQATLHLQVHGVDSPLITSTTEITISPDWPGVRGLFGDEQQQFGSLGCFLEFGDLEYHPAPPRITVFQKTKSDPARVKITDTSVLTDGPEIRQIWTQGPWRVTKHTWGYRVAFQPGQLASGFGHGAWTVTVRAPGLTMQDPERPPSADDGRGTLTWSFPAGRQPIPSIETSLTSPWLVRMNLATNRWPTRWFSDAAWTLGDGVLLAMVGLWAGARLLRRNRDGPDQRSLSAAVLGVSFLSVACYVYYVIDDYVWHQADGDAVRLSENLVLVAVAVPYFLLALGVRWRTVAVVSGLSAWITVVIAESPVNVGAGTFVVAYDIILRVFPLLSAMVLIGAGTVLWIRRLWPFGEEFQGLRDLSRKPFRVRQVIGLVAGMFILNSFILGQSAAASYYYWQHSDPWWQGRAPGALDWVTGDLSNDVHWWVGDGIQWWLYLVIAAGIFAALRAISADARGVFFAASADRHDLALMAAITAILFVGTWGIYDGVSLPLPCIVTFAGLVSYGLTRKLSKLDLKLGEGDPETATGGSFLVNHRIDMLVASEHAASAVKQKTDTEAAAAGSAPGISASADRGQNSPPGYAKLPTEDPGVTALALGPADTWWDNGVAAVRVGRYLALIPIIFDLYIYWTAGELSQLNFPFGLQAALGIIAGTIIAWYTGLFMFGVLLPYLKGIRTPVKGIVFGLIAFAAYAADAAVRHALGVTPYNTFIVDGLFAMALLATVGLLLDIETLRKHHGDQGLISNIYRLGAVRVAVTYATTLIIVGVGVWQTVYLTGQSAQERAQNIANTAQYVGTAHKPG
jgi:hypothetical protein